MVSAAVKMESLVDPEYRATFDALPRRVLDPSDVAASVKTIREAATTRRAAMAEVPLPDSVSVEDHLVPGPDGASPVTVRVYRSTTSSLSTPVLYYIHGGGMIGGTLELSDPYCASIADRLGVVVASVEYRLAPEYPYPAPLEDCYAGLQWVWQNTNQLGVDRGRLGIGGGSAGGGLAAGLALLARDRGEISVRYQHLVYPMLDHRNSTPSSHAITDDRVWNRDTNTVGWNAYLAGRAGQEDVSPYASPACADDLSGLPPAYICVGTVDLFVDEDTTYAQALRLAGVPIELHVYPGAFHGSQGSIPDAALSRRWREDEMVAIDRALNGPSPV
ncbi:MAG TPA: alpha/beta hydrolase [Dehalococcoidia bacterium]|nr:alpha/beta hydrolase [Dehalococcoidia bacterium]